IISLPVGLPAIYMDRYIREGSFVTSGFAPELQPMFDKNLGYSTTYEFVGTASSAVATDGQNLLMFTSYQGGAILLHRSTDKGLSWSSALYSAIGLGNFSSSLVNLVHISG